MICRVIISLIYAYPNRLFARFFPPYSFYNILPVNIYQGDYAYVFDYKKDQYIQINLVLGALDFDTSDDEPILTSVLRRNSLHRHCHRDFHLGSCCF